MLEALHISIKAHCSLLFIWFQELKKNKTMLSQHAQVLHRVKEEVISKIAEKYV